MAPMALFLVILLILTAKIWINIMAWLFSVAATFIIFMVVGVAHLVAAPFRWAKKRIKKKETAR